MPEIIQTNTAEVYRLSHDVIVLKFKTDCFVTLEDAKSTDQALMELADGKPAYFIINALDIQSNMETDALRYFARESKVSDLTLAGAIILNTLHIRLTASVFIKFHKPVWPAKIFLEEEKALDWFNELKES